MTLSLVRAKYPFAPLAQRKSTACGCCCCLLASRQQQHPQTLLLPLLPVSSWTETGAAAGVSAGCAGDDSRRADACAGAAVQDERLSACWRAGQAPAGLAAGSRADTCQHGPPGSGLKCHPCNSCTRVHLTCARSAVHEARPQQASLQAPLQTPASMAPQVLAWDAILAISAHDLHDLCWISSAG